MSPSAVTSPSPATDPLPATSAHNASADVPAKISAYYSLVFPNITFFLQTLSVTIGRRCLPPTPAPLNGTDGPPSTQSPVDVDLGPLKSVSRLHARIEYEEEEARFVLVVVGRNGAWVDGVWSGAGSRVPLGERSQIQIASRTFHFVLPPPSAPEDSPSPSSASSVQRARSPSVDITSISPPSSLPSHSPSPRTAPSLPPPKPPRSPEPQLPNSNAIPRTKGPSASTSTPVSAPAAPTSKKRKKASNPPPKPDVMPPKPSFTYAQLCYRAIKAMGGKATLQDICGWMMDNYDWYRYNEGAGWENSVRHNLSSGRAFKKMERSTGEHGKGFFWSVDEQYEHTFEQQEARAAAQAQAQAQSASSSALPASGKDGGSKNTRKKDKAVPLDPPLKRSVKSGVGPLPPPLTSTPLAFPLGSTQAPALGQLFTTVPRAAMTVNVDLGATAQGTKSESADPPRIGSTATVEGLLSSVASSASSSGLGTPFTALSGCGPSSSTHVLSSVTSSTSVSASPFAALPPSVCLPIVIGPVPSSHPSSGTSDPPPIVLHNNTLVLSPVIFSSLASEQLKALEEMGAQKALEVLQGHIVRYLKERMGKKKRKKATPGCAADKGGTKTGKGDASERSSPFTTIPLPSRTAQSTPMSRVPIPGSAAPHPLAQMPTTGTTFLNLSDTCTPAIECSAAWVKEGVASSVDNSPPVPVPISDNGGSQIPTIVVDDEDDEEGRVTKRRKLGNEVKVEPVLKHEGSAAQVSQDVDEDIEVDVC